MSFVTIAVGVGTAAVSAGVAAHQANKQKKSIRDANGRVMDFADQNGGAFGQKIDFEPIEYTPLFQRDKGYADIAADTIAGNQRNLGANLGLMRTTNEGITQDSLSRINTLYPGLQGQFAQQSANTSNLLAGNIPREDAMGITARRTEAASLGGGGAAQQQVAADLGLTRMQLMQQGAANLTNNVNLWNSIDPISRRVTPQSMFVDPQQAIQQAAAENQFASTFAASERDAELNYNMLPDPQLAGKLNLLGQQAGVQAATPMQSTSSAALMAGLNAAAGAYANRQSSNQWGGALNSSQPYVGNTYAQAPIPAYASAMDRQNGIPALSGPVTPYNASTGASFGETGSLASFFTPQNHRKYGY